MKDGGEEEAEGESTRRQVGNKARVKQLEWRPTRTQANGRETSSVFNQRLVWFLTRQGASLTLTNDKLERWSQSHFPMATLLYTATLPPIRACEYIIR